MTILEALYSRVPKTTCTKSSCASWCCTKLVVSEGDSHQFMPLPLIYSIEYAHIKDYLDTHIPDWKHHFDFSKKSRVCPFKDPHSPKCNIYPVRPFSCRVYGRKVPPILWGVRVTQEQIKHIECSDVLEDEEDKVPLFHADFEKMWWLLTKASMELSLFDEEIRHIILEVTGMPEILILAFGEFEFLKTQNKAWFQSHFKEYWDTVGNLL